MLFGRHGNVSEVLISPRRNKFGRHFDFARFRGAEDLRMLVVRLDNIIVDGKKIHTNQPRFSRKSEGFANNMIFNRSNIERKGRVFIQHGSIAKGRTIENKSYEVIVVDGVVHGADKSYDEEFSVIRYICNLEDRSRWSKTYIE